ENAVRMSREIQSLAFRAAGNLAPSTPEYQIARHSIRHPIEYMRYAEFEAMLRSLQIKSHTKVLDVSGPQWFSLCLAATNPETSFHYVNLLDSELTPYREIARALNIPNIIYRNENAREMKFANDEFDQVISISVIEHIYPAGNGDQAALN